ncbi:MAG: ABC transporter substrate-binding protein [Planctomycetota bacterium]
MCVGWLASCDQNVRPSYTDQQLRIVSLLPAITHVLIELGLQDAIVAVGDYDDLAPLGTPSLGRFVDLDLERLATLAPTHVLAATGQAGLPERVNQMAEQGRFKLADLPYPGQVEAGIALIRQVGQAIGRETKTSKLAAEMEHQLDRFAALTAERDRPRTLMVFNLERVMASGPNTVNDELLHIAGGTNAATDTTVTAPIFDREALRALAPEVIFVLMPGEPPLVGMDDPRLDGLRGLSLPAMENQRVYLLNDPAVLLTGPSMVTTAVSMAVALHPDLAEPIAEVFRETP